MTVLLWRRRALLAVALVLVATGCGRPPAVTSTTRVRPAVEAVVEVGFTVADLARSVAFFRDVLDFEKLAEAEVSGVEASRLHGVTGMRARVARLRLGAERLVLTQVLQPRGRSMPAGSRSNDRWFQHVAIIVSDMDRAHRRLREHRVVSISPAPQTLPAWNPKAGGIRAFYFQDADGHPLEVLQFPPDKGERRWHETDRLFLGIDHTAIVARDTDASLRFYRDLLGLRVAGVSDNHGPAQERLNNVAGAHLRITTLRAPAGPGIELLEYLSPRDGRPAPLDGRASDLWHWQTTLLSDHAEAIWADLAAGRALFVSPGVVALPPDSVGVRRGFIVRDPDGHAVEVVGR